ncbi:MAG: hypothetical protein GXY33_16495 [Phycisphaerae bacterium]|nr:hypothetical protein [Phycisphaerae bacterium]
MGLKDPKPPPFMPTPPKTCAEHPDRLAAWQCDACQACFCRNCVEQRDYGEFRIEICRRCGGRCRPIVHNRPAPPESPKSLWTRLRGWLGRSR